MTTESTYFVEGMTCGGCAGKVTSHVEQIPGVIDVDVDLATGGITVTSENPLLEEEEAVTHAVEQAGYRLATG